MGGIERRVQDNAACLFTDAGFPFLFSIGKCFILPVDY
jgi:hypothetical protein